MTALVSDATALIVLAKLGQQKLLKQLFSSVWIPSTVFTEITAKADHDVSIWDDPYFSIQKALDDKLYKALLVILDPGESEAIALAAREGLPLLIDEKKGRTIAQSLDITVIGLVGIFLALKQKGFLDLKQIRTLLDEAMRIGFRLSDTLYKDFCQQIES
jgi:predicted nucleic acid-binding protein